VCKAHRHAGAEQKAHSAIISNIVTKQQQIVVHAYKTKPM
jgi:hypothetical protein